MSDQNKIYCPDCRETVPAEPVDRRDFIRHVGVGAAALAAAGSVPSIVRADDPPAAPRGKRPAEDLVRELYTGLTAEQRGQIVLPWTNTNRTAMVNAAIGGQRISAIYTRPQQELIERILRSISSGDDGYRLLTRNGTFDGSREFGGCGSHIFGDPSGRQWAWVFSGHHITVRCDGNSDPSAAFGGPMYYGHSPDGYSNRNCFYYQTRSALAVYESLTEAQRRTAIVEGTPGEQAASVRFRERDFPGLAAGEMTADQRRLVEQVMRDVLSPYRREDADEVMDIIRRNGGLQRLHLAFYRDRGTTTTNWHFWRVEGPGFVWNFRVLPHVHTFVNIAARA